ncbi:hypothetical protein VFPPC_11398 [Pochonia chlamydosporia 170]|uniref:BZIP domain-containing protein n=1 Tax=Pochonia chlamydosporia 170 TaxID=1380566 RepID=A0A179EY14_METCM|nr:hypothetical protein VFPPC_11398 [Pochonia chlamydosporia 170]OAQ58086.2 hypothetical protein VFPPC_11398 [Pochonia chlamydosporia 170]
MASPESNINTVASKVSNDSPGGFSNNSSPITSLSNRSPRSGPEDVEWAEVTDREERRRIQNRISQRRFRQKAKERRAKENRELQNQKHAGNIYCTPTATYLNADQELSGLPWGSLSICPVANRGHVRDTQQSGSLNTHIGELHQVLCPDGTSIAPSFAPDMFLEASWDFNLRTLDDVVAPASPASAKVVEAPKWSPPLGSASPGNGTDSIALPPDCEYTLHSNNIAIGRETVPRAQIGIP